MNVLHIREQLSRGGIEILLYNLFKNNNKEEVNLYLLTLDTGDMEEEFKEFETHLIRLKRKNKLDVQLIREIRNLIKRYDIDIVHSHQAVEGLHAFFATRKLDVRNIITHHGSVYPLKDKLVMKYLIPRMDANIVVSNSYLERMKKEGFNISKNFEVIYNGIDPKPYQSSIPSLRLELNLDNQQILLGMIGNFYNSGRDHLTVCRMLPKLFEQFKNVHFVFVGGWSKEGSGDYKECYKLCKDHKILDRTHFVGMRKDIPNILNSIDIFVYSSNHDTFGIAVVEAMLAGKPVVVNNIKPMLEITNGGRFAEVFGSKDPLSLQNKVEHLILNKSYRQELGEKGREWANQNFTITIHSINLFNLYSKLYSA